MMPTFRITFSETIYREADVEAESEGEIARIWNSDELDDIEIADEWQCASWERDASVSRASLDISKVGDY
jgi:hypothetical protein